MTNLEIAQQKEEYIKLCREYIHRDGLEALLAYLDKSDFFTAPSSTRFHLNEEGGLCKHSINVFKMAKNIYEKCGIVEAIKDGTSPFNQEIDMESLAIACFFHDLCKIGVYSRAEKYRKDANGRWETYLTWEFNENFPIGHAEKSIAILNRFIQPKQEEMLAIRWHMGAFDLGDNETRTFYEALDKHPLVSLVMSADFLASKYMELTTEA